eukprot:630333-Rhodomonas_salina.1
MQHQELQRSGQDLTFFLSDDSDASDDEDRSWMNETPSQALKESVNITKHDIKRLQTHKLSFHAGGSNNEGKVYNLVVAAGTGATDRDFNLLPKKLYKFVTQEHTDLFQMDYPKKPAPGSDFICISCKTTSSNS